MLFRSGRRDKGREKETEAEREKRENRNGDRMERQRDKMVTDNTERRIQEGMSKRDLKRESCYRGVNIFFHVCQELHKTLGSPVLM